MDRQTSAGAGRRGFLGGLAGWSLAAAVPGQAQTGGGEPAAQALPHYTRRIPGKSLKQSSYDRTGGNRDFWPMAPGETREVFQADGAGVISHVWFTIASPAEYHLKELVLRAWWDGNSKPSVEVPIGDFFGLNLASYVIYQSAYLACSPGKSLNCYFAMPYAKGARMAVTNEGSRPVSALYSNIDYRVLDSLPPETYYFHAQYRQAQPCIAITGEAAKVNLDGKNNYVFVETHGRGHLMGITLGVLENADGWWGEGDEMIFVDDETRPVINGTGSEDYLLASWDFGGRETSQPFAHWMYGAPLIQAAERTGGRYHVYRWHGDNPVSFNSYLRHTIEHGHANDRGDNFFSVAYWYQDAPYTDFPALPPVHERIPRVKTP